MTAAALETSSAIGLRILAELPAFLGERIRRHRESNPDAAAEDVAKMVVNELNNGQRWHLATQRVAESVEAYDRAAVRQIEKEAVRKRSRRPVDPAAVERLRQELSEVRALAERQALSMVITLSPDLLDAPIHLGDGTTVLTGDATASEHETRIALLEGHAAGVTDTLARSIALLNLLRQSGCTTLREVTP